MPHHKHALLMMQYAEDAMKSKTPWDLWECGMFTDTWIDIYESPRWEENVKYRRKHVELKDK